MYLPRQVDMARVQATSALFADNYLVISGPAFLERRELVYGPLDATLVMVGSSDEHVQPTSLMQRSHSAALTSTRCLTSSTLLLR